MVKNTVSLNMVLLIALKSAGGQGGIAKVVAGKFIGDESLAGDAAGRILVQIRRREES